MNPITRDPSTPATEATLTAGPPTLTASTSVAEHALPASAAAPVPATTTPTAPPKLATSVSGSVPARASRIATLTAALRGHDVADVEAALASVREAYRRGDLQIVEAALIDQAMLLQALGERLVTLANSADMYQVRHAYVNVGLRALENSRKTLATLATLRGSPKNQTNVQVNVGAQPQANEILEVSDE